MKPRIPNWPVIPSSEITPESLWLRRRDFMKAAAAGAIVGGLPCAGRWRHYAARL
jgi:hypothetical protein